MPSFGIIVQSEPDDQVLGPYNTKPMTFLMNAISSEELRNCGMCNCAYDLLMKIQENAEGTYSDLRANVSTEFIGFEYEKNESMLDYIGRFDMLLARMDSLSYSVPEDQKIQILRRTLPPKWKNYANMWIIANKKRPVKELMSELKHLYHADRLSEKDENKETTFTSSEKKTSEDKVTKPSNSDRRSNDQERFSSRKEIDKSKWKCDYCKEVGHG